MVAFIDIRRDERGSLRIRASYHQVFDTHNVELKTNRN